MTRCHYEVHWCYSDFVLVSCVGLHTRLVCSLTHLTRAEVWTTVIHFVIVYKFQNVVAQRSWHVYSWSLTRNALKYSPQHQVLTLVGTPAPTRLGLSRTRCKMARLTTMSEALRHAHRLQDGWTETLRSHSCLASPIVLMLNFKIAGVLHTCRK